jgi:hypothetical protein
LTGKPSTIAGGDVKSLLRSIPAANIADVEVMTNPGAKYDPEGMAGIINIVLKENKFAGLNGNFNSSADSRGGKNISGQVNWRTITFNTLQMWAFVKVSVSSQAILTEFFSSIPITIYSTRITRVIETGITCF